MKNAILTSAPQLVAWGKQNGLIREMTGEEKAFRKNHPMFEVKPYWDPVSNEMKETLCSVDPVWENHGAGLFQVNRTFKNQVVV